MADNDIDPAGSTQMFRAFVDNPEPQTPAASSGNRTGVIAAVVILAAAIVAAVAWLALK
jgi:hypothetical protein